MFCCIKQIADKKVFAALFLLAILWANPFSAFALEANSSNLFTVQALDNYDPKESYVAIVKGAGAQNIMVNSGTYVQCQEGWNKSPGDSLQIVIKSSDSGDILARGDVELTTQTSVYSLEGSTYAFSAIIDLANLACGKAWWLRIDQLKK